MNDKICMCGPSFWDIVYLVGAGFVFGVAASLFFGLLVVVK